MSSPIQQLSLSEQAASQAEFFVTNVHSTDYQHTLSVDVDRGIYDLDCNGFVSFFWNGPRPTTMQ